MSIASFICDMMRGHEFVEQDVLIGRVKTARMYCPICKHSEMGFFAPLPDGGWLRVGHNDPRITGPLFGGGF